MNDVQERVIILTKRQLEEINPDLVIGLESDLSSLGVNSVSFIKLVVAIEKEFDIEFNDNDLDFSKFKIIKDVANVIEQELNKKN